MANIIRDVKGEGRWVTYTTYRLCNNNDVEIESYLEDDNWAGYGSPRENESFRIVKLSECPQYIQDKFLSS